MANHTPADQKEPWDREQWEGEGQDDIAGEHVPDDKATHWNKQQWEGEGQDDTPLESHTRESDEEMGEGDSELSGHGQNPGGGQRWGDVDPS